MNYIANIILGAVILGGTFYVVDKAFALPDVWFSYSTNECVKVINYTDETFSCENLPTKFHHVWVE